MTSIIFIVTLPDYVMKMRMPIKYSSKRFSLISATGKIKLKRLITFF